MTDFKKRITSSDVLTFDPEESLLRGQIPLKEFRDILKNHDETKVTKISFSRNGYCNDAVLKLIQSYKKKDYENLFEVKLDGCFLITNAGIKWLSDVIQGAKNLKKITLDGCKDLTDNELYLIAKTMGPFCEINMRGTSLRYITDIERNRVNCLGCTILGTDSIVDMKDSHAVIVPHDSMENSLAHLIMEKKTVKRQTFHHMTDFKTDGNWNFTLTELSLTQPLFDVVVSRNLSQVIIPFNGASDTQDIKKHVTDTILKILSKLQIFLACQDQINNEYNSTCIAMPSNKWSKIESLVQNWVEDEDPNLLVVYLPNSKKGRQQVICKGSLRLMDVITPDFIQQFTEKAYRKAPYIPTIKEVLPAITPDVVETNVTIKRHILSDITQKYMTKKKKVSRGYWGMTDSNQSSGPQISLLEVPRPIKQPSIDNSPSTNDNVQNEEHGNDSLCDFLIDGNIEVLQCEMDQRPFMYTAVPIPSQPQIQTDSVRWKITPGTQPSYDNEVQGTNGLYNLNNNCWLNSALQSLKQIMFPQLDRKSLGENSTITKVMELITKLQQPVITKVNYSVEHILDALHDDDSFGDTDKGIQQDPCNFFETVLEKLTQKGLFHMLQIQNTLKCIQCDVERTGSNEPLPILIVDAKPNESIQDCIDRYFHQEIMEGSESVNCTHCKQATQHIRRSRICEEPSTLVLQVKRFDPVNFQKSTKLVTPSRQISLPVHSSNSWELSAVIVHTGTSISCGHYVTYTLDGDKMFLYDDLHVLEKSAEVTLSSRFLQMNGYIYLYQQKE